MRRRQFLASTALLGATGLAGCNRVLRDGPTTPSAPASVANWEFDTKKPNTESEGPPDAEKPPDVRCLPESDTVVISGTTEAGDDCDELVPKTIAVDGDTFEFAVGVYDGDPPSGCSDILYIRAYRASFEFRNGLPTRIVAVERWGPRDTGPRRKFTTCP